MILQRSAITMLATQSAFLRACLSLMLWNASTIQGTLEDDFWRQRNRTISVENLMRIGGKIKLTKDEEKVNQKLMQFKFAEIKKSQSTGYYPPSNHFFFAKAAIEDSDVFKLIKRMPKGAALHLHDSSMVDARWFVKQTYNDSCYMCFQGGKPAFKFMDKIRADPACDQPWRPVSYYRKSMYKTPAMFDEMLYRNLTMVTDNPQEDYPTQGKIWQKFYSCFQVNGGILDYVPVFRNFFREALQEFYNDNVQYLEFRALLPELYELNGTTHTTDYVIQLYREVLKEFISSHPTFIGAKLIYSSVRHINSSVVLAKVKESITYVEKYPDFFVGFDLVGREDDGYSLTHFLNDLLYPQKLSPPVHLPYFFHAGETDWEGTDIDDNIVSAIFLNTSRIGHGYALTKHPVTVQLVKQRGIAIEINPVSNQVLDLVSDLRNHPGSVLFAQDMPVVISSDDPGLWGALPLSHDFYEAFMGLAGKQGDLKTLKQLAINSIVYSAMTEKEKTEALAKWSGQWHKFIADSVHLYDL